MKIEIPESLFFEIRKMLTREKYINFNTGPTTVKVTGPYGEYELTSVPDVDYTEVITKEVRQYKTTESRSDGGVV